jgi:hypothetical protein
MNEYFNSFEESLQKASAETIAALLKRVDEQYELGI